jgi:hypothetical protein
MEEKVNKLKVVKNNLTAKPSADQKQEKLSYEQLENIAHQLSEQSRQLYTKLQEANLSNMFKRLDYLFKVLEYSGMFNPDFVDKCVNEVEETITLPEKKEEAADNKDSLKEDSEK